MAVPILKLDLAPPSNLWRMNHAVLGMAALTTGCLLLAASVGLSWRAFAQASAAGRRTVTLVAQTSLSTEQQRRILSELREVDVAKELPRWRLAEKIFTERSLPWSRLTAELERSLVDDVRLKSIQRTRSSDMKVQLKIKGEARTRAAEAKFVTALQANPFFEAVLLEREGERQGGGVEFDYTLAAETLPPPYVPLPRQPKYGPAKPLPAPVKAALPVKAAQPLKAPAPVVQPPPAQAAVYPGLPQAARSPMGQPPPADLLRARRPFTPRNRPVHSEGDQP